jgi:hypothetical protein
MQQQQKQQKVYHIYWIDYLSGGAAKAHKHYPVHGIVNWQSPVSAIAKFATLEHALLWLIEKNDETRVQQVTDITSYYVSTSTEPDYQWQENLGISTWQLMLASTSGAGEGEEDDELPTYIVKGDRPKVTERAPSHPKRKQQRQPVFVAQTVDQ